jgi:hypothetical protein
LVPSVWLEHEQLDAQVKDIHAVMGWVTGAEGSLQGCESSVSKGMLSALKQLLDL